MKIKTTLLMLTALALVSGCSRGGTANNSAGGNTASKAAAPANTVAPASAPAPVTADAAGEGGGAVDVAFLTGRWAENGNCAEAVEFRADGTFSPPDGSTYSLAGNVLTINLNTPGSGPPPATVVRLGEGAMTFTANGNTTQLTRC